MQPNDKALPTMQVLVAAERPDLEEEKNRLILAVGTHHYLHRAVQVLVPVTAKKGPEGPSRAPARPLIPIRTPSECKKKQTELDLR
jgi:hypothetical protein